MDYLPKFTYSELADDVLILYFIQALKCQR